jgi:type III restriction enzyme
VKFIITQKALAEGWDCPFAYILVSMASLHSATAVEQLLGRVLRQPGASHRSSRLLNQSYAFVVSRNFAETANALRERLVAGAGFERREVSEFVTAATSEQARLDLDGHAGRVFVRPVTIALPEKPDLKGLPKPIRNKLSWDARLNTLTISAPLTADEGEVLKATVTSEAAVSAIGQAAEASRTSAIEFFQTPAELGERFQVPQLAWRVQGALQLFDDPELLEYPWDLSCYAAAPSLDDVNALNAGLKASEGGEIDIDTRLGPRGFALPARAAARSWPGLSARALERAATGDLVVPQPARSVADPCQQAGFCRGVADRTAQLASGFRSRERICRSS